eukprot:Seg1756.12 transcript_id=Seg1756.12/GoldUCD/mRNA.D3Y31 product="Choline/ethanolamine kinase" protein_id=Seg1756.12/GoldUCD/D3Y31
MDSFKKDREALIEQSKAKMAGLLNKAEDLSLEKEAIHLKSCEDAVLRANAYKWCKRCLRGAWARITQEKLSVQYVSGGLTNYLYLCSLPNDVETEPDEPSKVLVRIYGAILDNRAKFYEGVIFTLLAERGFGPHLYGVFSSGRVEQYVPSRHLYTKELADAHLSTCIATTVAKYHCMDLPLNKEPTLIWENMETWLSMTEGAEFNDPHQQEMLTKIKSMNLADEYFKLKKFLINTNSTVVFCHNDVQEGNILLLKEQDKIDVMLIDYEYSSYSYRGFDLGNHFCEWMYDYSNEESPKFFTREEDYPTRSQQVLFVKQYLITYNKIKGISLGEPTEAEIEQLVTEGNRFALASHLLWGFWSVVQARVSKIDFGYLEYAIARFETYFRQKKLFMTES